MAVWHWIATGLAVWLLLSVAVAALWVVVARRWKTRHRNERRRRES
jgi:hypothetical protein